MPLKKLTPLNKQTNKHVNTSIFVASTVFDRNKAHLTSSMGSHWLSSEQSFLELGIYTAFLLVPSL